jgi:hypothetical protein
MTSTRRHTTLIVSALLAGLGPLVGNALYAGPTGTGQELMDQLSDPLPAGAYAGIALELVGAVALVVLLAVLAVTLARRAPVAAVATVIAGSAMMALKFVDILPIMALRLGPDRVDAGVAGVLVDLNEAGFVVGGLLLSLALACAGIGLLQTRALSPWLAWWPTVAGVLGVVAGAVGIAAPDSYVPIPLLLLLWMVVLAVTTVVRRPSDLTMASDPVAVPQ